MLPVPWFAPHIRVGRDYDGDNLAGVASMRRLEEAMIAAFPDHFAEPPPPSIDTSPTSTPIPFWKRLSVAMHPSISTELLPMV